MPLKVAADQAIAARLETHLSTAFRMSIYHQNPMAHDWLINSPLRC